MHERNADLIACLAFAWHGTQQMWVCMQRSAIGACTVAVLCWAVG